MTRADGERYRWHAVEDEQAMQGMAMETILISAKAAIKQRGQFHIVLAGGNTPRGLYAELSAAQADWSAWHIYFSDERCLPRANAERNSRMAAEIWLDHVPIPTFQLHPIPAELGAVTAARLYADLLKTVPTFDVVLLGLGEDGHTASLFSGHDWGATQTSLNTLAILDAPKPPQQRVSQSATRLSRARKVMFLVSGESKRQAVMDWRAGKDIPARSIAPTVGVDILVDAALLFPLKERVNE
jgi:6-phosphogluconolactonase